MTKQIFKINCPVSTDSLGAEVTEDQAGHYRAWVKRQLKTEYPHHIVFVTSAVGVVVTDDFDRMDEIVEFAGRLWDDRPMEIFA